MLTFILSYLVKIKKYIIYLIHCSSSTDSVIPGSCVILVALHCTFIWPPKKFRVTDSGDVNHHSIGFLYLIPSNREYPIQASSDTGNGGKVTYCRRKRSKLVISLKNHN